MSYMRGDPYVFVSGYDNEEYINIWSKQRTPDDDPPYLTKNYISLDKFDELVVMRMAELIDEGKLEATITRAVKNNGGNVGCCALELQKIPKWLGSLKKKETA